jgi:hypothetical protein
MNLGVHLARKEITMRVVTAIAVACVGLAVGASPVLAQQAGPSDTANTLQAAKNKLHAARAQEQKDTVTGASHGLRLSPQALKLGRSANKDSLKKAPGDSDSSPWKDSLRLDLANKKLSALATGRPPAQVQRDQRAKLANRSLVSAARKNTLTAASAKGKLAADRDELKRSH